MTANYNYFYFSIPSIFFITLYLLESIHNKKNQIQFISNNTKYSYNDCMLNLIGFFMQGFIVPMISFFIASLFMWMCSKYQINLLNYQLKVGFWGAFAINFVFIDLLYYFQHRFFHYNNFFWKLHLCHHNTPKLSIWSTSRNNLFINILFVYILVNPIFIALLDRPDGFIFGAMLTAGLDLLRHTSFSSKSRILNQIIAKYIGKIILTPSHHHRHHHYQDNYCNYGANLIIWDKLFGTYKEPILYSSSSDNYFNSNNKPNFKQQLLYPIYSIK